MRRKVAQIVKERGAGEAVIPVLQYADIAAGSVTPAMVSKIKDRGACVIRQTFPAEQARAWDDELARYVEDNGLYQKLANAAEDKYFGTLAAAKPQIYGVYWSRPQVEARQSESLTRVRAFLNHLWLAESEGRRHFDPEQTPVYADGIRRRPPGSSSLGLSLMLTAVLSSGGWSRISGAFIGTYSLVTGASTTHSTRHGGLTRRNFPRRPCARCSERSKVGLR